jgi:hypothetical protein
MQNIEQSIVELGGIFNQLAGIIQQTEEPLARYRIAFKV